MASMSMSMSMRSMPSTMPCPRVPVLVSLHACQGTAGKPAQLLSMPLMPPTSCLNLQQQGPPTPTHNTGMYHTSASHITRAHRGALPAPAAPGGPSTTPACGRLTRSTLQAELVTALTSAAAPALLAPALSGDSARGLRGSCAAGARLGWCTHTVDDHMSSCAPHTSPRQAPAGARGSLPRVHLQQLRPGGIPAASHHTHATACGQHAEPPPPHPPPPPLPSHPLRPPPRVAPGHALEPVRSTMPRTLQKRMHRMPSGSRAAELHP